jgi:xylan 1,4-beta-xylosidase
MASCAGLALLGASATAAPDDVPVRMEVDAGRTLGPVPAIWRFFGADEPNYATMKDGRELVRSLGALRPGAVYFRTHNLLTSGDGTPALKWGSTGVYGEDAQGRAVYDWTIVDRIFRTYLDRGVRPYVQIGFMPEALSRRPQPYQHAWRPGLPYGEIFTGWAHPPKDEAKWAELVRRWAEHSVEVFGRDEVAKWYWETWNEPNIAYWQGTPGEFYRLHDFAVDAVRRVLPEARVGGPDAAGGGGPWMQAFLEHCLRGTNAATGRTGTPLDFVAFHAKGAPTIVDGHVRMGIARQLQEIDKGFAVVASFPELRTTPIVIGESDPEGCAACQGPALAYRNGTMYSSYTAAIFPRKLALAAKHGVNLEGALTWAFEFEDQPYFAGFRALASSGLDLPVLNVFRLFAKMSGESVPVTSSAAVPLEAMLAEGVRGAPDVSATAARDGKRLAILAWHYHDDDVAGPEADVELAVKGLPAGVAEVAVTQYRIDDRHANAYAEWKRMGSPLAPNREQYDRLRAASVLSPVPDEPARAAVQGGEARLALRLPRQAVALVMLEWK